MYLEFGVFQLLRNLSRLMGYILMKCELLPVNIYASLWAHIYFPSDDNPSYFSVAKDSLLRHSN